MNTNTHAKARRESYGFLFLVGGILVLLNVLGVFYFGRLDLTDKQLFSLSDGSKRLASSLSDRMEIVAYFTDDLPPPFNATERYVRDILAEYEAASKGKIRVRHVNPNNEEKMQEAERDGIRKVSHQVIENDSVNVREGFRGVVFKYLGENKNIAVIEDTAGLEYQVTQLIKEMVGEKTAVGVLAGHEGPTLEKGLSGLRQATPTYTLTEVNAASAIDTKMKALVIAGPESPLNETELKNIDAYVAQGGALGIFGGTFKISTEGYEPKADYIDTGLSQLTEKWSVKLGKGMVADAMCGRAPMQTQYGLAMYVPYPLVPIVTFEEVQREHPVLFRLDQVGTPFTAPLTLIGKPKDLKFKRTVLAKSSKQSWLIESDSVSLQPKHPREWDQSGRSGPFALAVALEGKVPSAFGQTGGKDTRVLVAGTAGFMRDEFLPKADAAGGREINSALAFALNALDWLTQDSDLIAIRAKNVEDPALEVPLSVKEAELEVQQAAEQRDKDKVESGLEKRKNALTAWDTKKAMYRWLNTVGLPLLFALFGVLRWQSRKAKKAKIAMA